MDSALVTKAELDQSYTYQARRSLAAGASGPQGQGMATHVQGLTVIAAQLKTAIKVMVCMRGGAVKRGRFGRQRLQRGGLRWGKASKPSSGGRRVFVLGWAHATGIAALPPAAQVVTKVVAIRRFPGVFFVRNRLTK